MKKVRYAFGVAGLVPAAAAFIAPATASAATLKPAQPNQKTVSHEHLGASAVEAHTAIRTCTGQISEGWITSRGFATSMNFFYTSFATTACIGTVYGKIHHIQPQLSWRIRVYGHGVRKINHFIGAPGNSPHYGIHQSFPDKVEVCTAWVNSQTKALIGGTSPICASVG